jgi:hypothetical protein
MCTTQSKSGPIRRTTSSSISVANPVMGYTPAESSALPLLPPPPLPPLLFPALLLLLLLLPTVLLMTLAQCTRGF